MLQNKEFNIFAKNILMNIKKSFTNNNSIYLKIILNFSLKKIKIIFNNSQNLKPLRKPRVEKQ